MSESLQDLATRAAFISTEAQTRFGALIADADWDVDFAAEVPVLHFTGLPASDAAEAGAESGDPTKATMRVHFLGSTSTSEGTWHWGWDNLNDLPANAVALSQKLHDHGTAHGITEFTTEEFPVTEAQAHDLALAAKAVTGRWAHYPASAGGGTLAWLLVEHPLLELGTPRIRRVVKAIANTISSTELPDHLAALRAYAEVRGFPLAMLPGGGLRILTEDGSADVTFDERNRITNCQVAAPLAGEAAEQFADLAAEAAAGVPAPLAVPLAPAPAKPVTPRTEPKPAPAPAPAPAQPSTPKAEPARPVAPAPVEPFAPTASTPEAAAATTTPVPETTETPATPEVGTPVTPAPAPSAPTPATEPTTPQGTPDSTPAQPAAASAEESKVEQTEKAEPTAPATPAPAPATDEPKKKGFFKKLFGGR